MIKLRIPLGILFNVVIGLVFSLVARDRLRADGPFAAPAVTLVAIFSLVISLPTALYLHLAHPAWTWMYLIDPARLPGLALLPLLVVHAGATIGGWYLGARLLRADNARLPLYVTMGWGAALVVAALVLSPRWLSYGTYAEYETDLALDLMDVKLGYVLVIFFLGTMASAGFVILELMRDSRRVRTR